MSRPDPQVAVVPAFGLIWFPLICVVTLIAGLAYGLVQQDLRLSADDPQIQLAEDTAAALQAGQPARALVPAQPVDLAASLAPFVLVYDDRGTLLAGSAQLQGAPPVVPPGVFAAVRSSGEDRISWEPAPGVREAAVITRVGGATPGFVVAGRSLREVERRIAVVEQIAAVGWVLGLLSTAVASAALAWAWSRARGGSPEAGR